MQLLSCRHVWVWNGRLLSAWRWVTGLGSALQMSGSQLCLADISRADNRSRCLGTNQACITVKVQTGTHNCDTPYLVLSTDMSYVGTSVLGDADTYQQIAPALAACSASKHQQHQALLSCMWCFSDHASLYVACSCALIRQLLQSVQHQAPHQRHALYSEGVIYCTTGKPNIPHPWGVF